MKCDDDDETFVDAPEGTRSKRATVGSPLSQQSALVVVLSESEDNSADGPQGLCVV
jgi:hypothetical protein